MHIFLGIFIFMLSSALLLVSYVLLRDIKYKKSQPAELADAGNIGFEEMRAAETILTGYADLRKKTA